MQHKFLLRFIKQEMQRQKIAFKNNEDFFRLFVSDEPWESYRSNMSNWLSSSGKDGVIHKHTFIEAVNVKLGLSSEIWGASELKQKEAVGKGVKAYKKALEEDAFSFPWLDEIGLSQEQKMFIDFAKRASVEDVEDAISSMADSLTKTSQNQPFLIALFTVMYEKGAYGFVYAQIFPHLLDTYDNTIKSKKAHIYASLPTPMYREAFDILSSIKGESKADTMDLRTSAISNIRRERLSSAELSKASLKGLLQTLIGSYKKIYVPKNDYGYYPAVNLAYMLGLVAYIFPQDVEVLSQGYSIRELYVDVEKSLAKAKASNDDVTRYYASMSEIEFQLLLGTKGMGQELEMVLETLHPSVYLIDQTQRQMGVFFLEVVKRYDGAVLDTFKEVLDILVAYKEARHD